MMWTYLALVTLPVADSLGYGTWQPYAASQPLTKVACSDGANGLITRWHYTDLSQMFPYVTAISGLNWNSPECGKCFKLTDVASKNSIFVTVIDAVPATPGYDMHYNIAEDAFKKLFGDAGVQAGHGELNFEEADFHSCQGNKGAASEVSATSLASYPSPPSLSYATWQPYTANLPLTKVACSDGANGLITRWHYTDLSQMFPYVTAISGLSWNSPKCGVCFKLTDVASKNSITVTVIDSVPAPPSGYDMHFNIAQPAFHTLFGDAGVQAGHGEFTYTEVPASECHGNKGPSSIDSLLSMVKRPLISYSSPLALSYATWQPYTANLPLTKVACSNGANGLITRWHYTELSPMFPYVTAINGLSWNSPQCGKCFKLTDVTSKNSISVTVIDAVPATPGYDMHFNIAQPAFHTLFGDAGIQAGHGELTFEETDFHNCQGNKGTSSSAEFLI